jgi:hypothetical protein
MDSNMGANWAPKPICLQTKRLQRALNLVAGPALAALSHCPHSEWPHVGEGYKLGETLVTVMLNVGRPTVQKKSDAPASASACLATRIPSHFRRGPHFNLILPPAPTHPFHSFIPSPSNGAIHGVVPPLPRGRTRRRSPTAGG